MYTFFASPLESFEVSPILGVHSPILNFSLTNLGFYVVLVISTYISMQIFALFSIPLVPSRYSLGFESAYTSMQSQTKENVSKESYLPFLYSLFFFILLCNLFGNVPYSFTVTSSVIVAIGFSVMIFIGVTILATVKHRLHFLSFFVPAGTPGPLVPLLIIIEIISYIARAFSLGIRLFANMVAGHALLNILSGILYKIMSIGVIAGAISLIPSLIFIALVGLEIAVSVIQAYVFTVLTITYIHDAEYLH